MNGEQLDLFPTPATSSLVPAAQQVAKTGAEIVVFPLACRRGKIVETAHTLVSRKTAEGKQSYWTRVIRSLRGEMQSRGCRAEEINVQLGAFRFGVGVELSHLEYGDRRFPGGAA